jgi:hypothetical protein
MRKKPNEALFKTHFLLDGIFPEMYHNIHCALDASAWFCIGLLQYKYTVGTGVEREA